MVFFDIWDSQSGSRMKAFVGRSLNFRGASCIFRMANLQVGAPFCTRCSRWSHTQASCTFPRVVCAICAGPHREFSTCCREKPKATPPVSPTPSGNPCPHRFHCLNCGKGHTATSMQCQFWRHRFDRAWIAQHIARAGANPPPVVTYLMG